MKKKYMLFTIIILFLFIFLYSGVCAQEYTCAYKVTFSKEYAFSVKLDPETEDISFSSFCYNTILGEVCREGSMDLLDYDIINTDKTLEMSKNDLINEVKSNLFSGKCDSTIVAFRYWSNTNQHEYIMILFNDTLTANAEEYMDGLVDFDKALPIPDSENSTVNFTGISYTCSVYQNYYDKLREISSEILNCNSGCEALYSEYDAVKTKTISFCNIQFNHNDFSESCVNACLKFNSDIKKISIENVGLNRTCGLSQRIILWIANIVKWAKYIVPVIVIVLSILDFIKAIGADKEDEIKKAQKHFIIRLIVAALIFILPFIIEFVLNKMGFSANGCGIIDL